MELFVLNKDKLIELSKAEIQTVASFKKLIKRDKDRDKKKAQAEITFIYLWIHPVSPFSNYKSDDKLKRCIANAGLDEKFDYQKDEDVVAAMKDYEEMLDEAIPSLGLLKDSMKVVDSVREFFRSAKISDPDDAKKILDSLKSIKGTSDSLIEQYKAVRAEMSLSSRLRGDAIKGVREDAPGERED